ncbi:MAG: TauD/TfdA family dioxygenase [Aquisalimonadaceae bacterium]
MSAEHALDQSMNITEALANAPFEIEPIGRTIGAEIHGLDLTRPISSDTFASLEAALIEHKVIYMRDQHMDTARHVEVGRMFGELEVHPFRPQGEFPEIMKLDNHKDNPVLSTDVWHSDTTFRRCPTKYSILRCLRIPKTGGDTLWADMTAAFNGLSDTMKTVLEQLDAVHDFKNFRALYTGGSPEKQEELRKMEELYPNPTHPVIRTHPVTGQKVLFVNGNFTLRIAGMHDDESQALLELLYRQAQVPEYQFRLRWKPGTIVFWDNRSTQHYASNDYYPDRRTMERVAVVGDEPF